MKKSKKLISLIILSLTASSCIISSYAKEGVESNKGASQQSYRIKSRSYYTTPSIYGDLELSVTKEIRDSDTYIIIETNKLGINVFINNSSIDVKKEGPYTYSYKVTSEGNYEVAANLSGYASVSKSIWIEDDDDDNTLVLSKELRDGDCYLGIKAADEDGIEKITVNGEEIEFNRYSGSVSYKLYHSGTYTVRLTDEKDNQTTRSLYVDIDNTDNGISLSLSEKQKDGKWYLVIKADADERIEKVTIGGRSVEFPDKGGTKEYQITKSGTYRVTIEDEDGQTLTKSLYIAVNEQENTDSNPTVSVTQNYQSGWYLIIKASDDRGIKSVTVNGKEVSFDKVQKVAKYYVPSDGTYTIVVTDMDGNKTTRTTYAAGNSQINRDDIEVQQPINGGHEIIFRVGSKNWVKDGVSQPMMDIAPLLSSSRTYLPIRYIAYALGIDEGSIIWNGTTKTVTINHGAQMTSVTVGSKQMLVGSRYISMDAAPIVSKGRVMLPLSQLKAAFPDLYMELNWNNATKTLTINR